MLKTDLLRRALSEANAALKTARRLMDTTDGDLRVDATATAGFASGAVHYLEKMTAAGPGAVLVDNPSSLRARFDRYEVKACVTAGGDTTAFDSDARAQAAFAGGGDRLFYSVYGVDPNSDAPSTCIGDFNTRLYADFVLSSIEKGARNLAFNAMCAWEWYLESGSARFRGCFAGVVDAREFFARIAPEMEEAWRIAQAAGYDDSFDWEFLPRWLPRVIVTGAQLRGAWREIAEDIGKTPHLATTLNASEIISAGAMWQRHKAAIVAAPLTAYKRPIIGADPERGEIFEAESPELDDRERDDKREFVNQIAGIATDLLALRAGDFRGKADVEAMRQSIAEVLADGLI